MDKFKEFEDFFTTYTNSFINREDIDDARKLNFKNKINHSYKVMNLMLEIAKREDLKLDEEIIKTLGLFHDIGRFLQYDSYETFNDAKSKDHAVLSIKVLEDNGIIQKIPYEKRKYVVDPILMHNKQDLPKLKDKKMYLYSALLRDADKLDSFRARTFYDTKNKNLAAFKGLSDEPVISENVYNDIMNHKTIYKFNLKTILEEQATVLGYITSDINFKATFEIIKENDYLTKMFSMMEDTPQSRAIYNFVEEYIDEKIRSN